MNDGKKGHKEGNEVRIKHTIAPLRKYEHTGGTPAKPVELLQMQLLRTMSTDSLLYINAGNLTGLRGVIGVLNVVIP